MPVMIARLRRRDPERALPGQRSDGQILALFALALVALIGFAAVAVDLGSYLSIRRNYQNAADAAALAGAPFLTTTTPDRTSARHAAWNSLISQLGITIGGTPWAADTAAATPVQDSAGKYSMWVSTPPIGAGSVTASKYPGAYTGSADKAVFVWVEANNPSYLSRIFGINGSYVSAWATAGIFPNRFAVITLRQPTQDGPAQEDIRLAGNNVSLTVNGGDVGGNWNMKLNSNNNLILPGDSQVYLHDYTSCGSSCWGSLQINNGSGTLKTALQLPGPIPDPNYPLPTSVLSAPTAPTAALPYGYVRTFSSADRQSRDGDVQIGSGGDSPAAQSVSTVGGVQTCDPATAVKIGPGYYTNIHVSGNYCIVLDPAYTHDCLSNGAGCTDTPTAVPATQMPGVFYINGTIDVGNNGMIVGDGVTVVMRPKNEPGDNGQFNVSGGASSPAIVDLNATKISAAWTNRGVSPYVRVTSGCQFGATSCWQYTNTYESDLTQTGMALYVMRRDQIPGSGVASDDWTSVIQVNANAGLAWNGITYAPHDSATLAGQPGHSGVGQLVSWTFTFNGGTNVVQTYRGPFSGIPLLLEPKLGQP
jgi:hypothetical protein